MNKFFSNIKKYHNYAIRSAKAELKSEVADSYLNWLWWIIEPVCFMLIYTFIFGYVFHNKTPYFASFVFIGLTAWDFFNRMVKGSVKLITSNRDLVKKVYIPKYILLLAKSYTYRYNRNKENDMPTQMHSLSEHQTERDNHGNSHFKEIRIGFCQ